MLGYVPPPLKRALSLSHDLTSHTHTQEERKVEALRAKLVEMGVDADGLIAVAAAADE